MMKEFSACISEGVTPKSKWKDLVTMFVLLFELEIICKISVVFTGGSSNQLVGVYFFLHHVDL